MVYLDDMEPMCGRCYDFVTKLYPANCGEKPEALLGQPIGMYHCPDCGAMLIAGIPHPELCQPCIDRTHPMFDAPGPMDSDSVVVSSSGEEDSQRGEIQLKETCSS